MNTIQAGEPFRELINVCYDANLPVLVSGPHGIGKSEMLKQVAKEMKIGYISRDLSLMEPPDLVGLPRTKGQRTVYCPPSFLPKRGKGLLVLEELNRCEKYVRAPCLQLLTARILNDYQLPPGWLPIAVINPSNDECDYEVDELDQALLSRFVQVQLIPNRLEWLDWARRHDVHSSVIQYVEADSSVFKHPLSNPRAWTYVSSILKVADRQQPSKVVLSAAIVGVVGETRATAFLKILKESIEQPLTSDQIITSYSKHCDSVGRWIRKGRLDLVKASLHSLLTHLQPKADYDRVRTSKVRWGRVGAFIGSLPGDLKNVADKFFNERKYDSPVK